MFENPDWEEFDVGNTIRALKEKSYFLKVFQNLPDKETSLNTVVLT